MSSVGSARQVATGGAVACVVLAALAVADQVGLGWTRRNVAAHYGRFGLHPDPDVLTVVLVVVFATGAAGFLLARRCVARGHRRAALTFMLCGAVAGLGCAGVATFAFEYDAAVFPSGWRAAPWVLPALCCWLSVRLLATRAARR